MPSTEATTDWAVLLEDSTREVFTLMLGCELAACTRDSECDVVETPVSGANAEPVLEVRFHKDVSAVSTAEVTAVVGMAGALCGVLNFACGINAARMVAGHMLGMDPAEVGDQQWDAIGEVCNMVAGNFKAKLPGIGERCMLSVPTIVVGSNY